MKAIHQLLLAIVVLTLCSCSTVTNSHRQKERMMSDWLAGRNTLVNEAVVDCLGSWEKPGYVVGSGDELIWRLEAGTVAFNMGDYAEAVAQFDRAEALIVAYDDRAKVSARDISAEAAVLVTNLNALPYRGWCRDRVAISIYKSLAYLGMGNETAFLAQLRRLRDAQKDIVSEYRSLFENEVKQLESIKAAKGMAFNADQIVNNAENAKYRKDLNAITNAATRGYGNFLNPAGTFLSALGLMREGDFGAASIEFKRLCAIQPDNVDFKRYYVTVLTRAGMTVPDDLKSITPFAFPLDRNCVFVLFANGRSVALKEVSINFPILTSWPACEYYSAPYHSLQLSANQSSYQTFQLSDMDGVMSQEFKERLPGIITRIVLSTLVKEGGSYTAAYFVGRENAYAGYGVLAASFLYRWLMNTADTRSWETLPKEFQLTQFPMPSDRKVTIDFGDGKKVIVTIGADAESAIIYVHGPSAKVLTVKALPLNSK